MVIVQLVMVWDDGSDGTEATQNSKRKGKVGREKLHSIQSSAAAEFSWGTTPQAARHVRYPGDGQWDPEGLRALTLPPPRRRSKLVEEQVVVHGAYKGAQAGVSLPTSSASCLLWAQQGVGALPAQATQGELSQDALDGRGGCHSSPRAAGLQTTPAKLSHSTPLLKGRSGIPTQP